MKAELLAAINEARRGRKPVAVVTDIKSGAQRLVAREAAEAGSALEKAFRFDKSGLEGDEFIAIHNPPLRLVMIGAVLIAQSVIPIAQACGYDVTVIDPRGAFATGARFPGVTLLADWPQDVLPGLGLDARTGFMALTHDPKIDDPALHLALKSQVFYIGALGSKKTQGARRERLLAAGFDEVALARICGPIGLNIGAMGAAEIAISVMAEMTKALRLGLP
ncbi:MAG: XdhC family protein [Alphaproteobacteria bacterium]|nr:XdhC family protein [Alphaproteobacteria bacterium]